MKRQKCPTCKCLLLSTGKCAKCPHTPTLREQRERLHRWLKEHIERGPRGPLDIHYRQWKQGEENLNKELGRINRILSRYEHPNVH